MAYGGELFNKVNFPNPLEYLERQEERRRYDRHQRELDRREEQRQEQKSALTIAQATNGKAYLTGSPLDKRIADELTAIRTKYAGLARSMPVEDWQIAMMNDLATVSSIAQKSKLINKQISDDVSYFKKNHKGINPEQIKQLALQKAFYTEDPDTGKERLKNEDELDADNNWVKDVFDNDYNKITINNNPERNKDITNRKTTYKKLDFTTGSHPGTIHHRSGVAKYDENYQQVQFGKDNMPEVSLRTSKLTRPDGSDYVDPETKKPVALVDENAYNDVISSPERRVMIYQAADKKANALRSKGITVDDSDLNVFRRQAATDELDKNLRSYTAFDEDKTTSYWKPSAAKGAGKTKETPAIDISAAPVDSKGYKDISGQVGGFNIGTSGYGRPRVADLLLTSNNDLVIREWETDEYGNRKKQLPDIIKPKAEAKSFIIANSGRNGNNKSDLLKLTGLFDDKQQPAAQPQQQQAAPAKKQIKRADIGAKAKAAGYTSKEYEALLRQNGITITD